MDGDTQQQMEPRVRGINSGTHFLFCGGRIVVGPDWRSLLGSTVLIIAPVVVFCIWVLPWVGQHLSWALVAISGVLIALSITMLATTAFKDPGFIPRSPPDEDVEYGMAVPTKDHQINGYTVTTKYCTTCSHYRPPRCSHCAVCDNCVDKFDHHCPWVGTCIGRRNYRYFLVFVYSTVTLCCWVFALSVANLVIAARDAGWSFGTAAGDHPAAIVCAVYTFLAFWFVGGLSALHTYLVCTNQTTYEHFRHRYSDLGNPYDNGLLANCWEAFCAPIPPRWGQLGLQQRAEASAAAAAAQQQQLQQQQQQAAEMAAGGDVQLAQMVRPAKSNGSHAAQPANGGHGVEVLPYTGEDEDLEAGPHADLAAQEAAGDLGHIAVAAAVQPGDWSLQRPSGMAISERVITADGSYHSYHSRDSSYRGNREGSHGAGGGGGPGGPGAVQLLYSQRSQSLGATSAAAFAAAAAGALEECEEEGSEEEVPMPAGAARAAAAAAVGARELQLPGPPPPPRLLAGRTRGQQGSSSSSLAAEAGGEAVGGEGTPLQQQRRVPPLGRLPPLAAPPPAPASLDFGLQSPRPPGST
ncbi:hypothetical protein ABPG75_000376 [Micractinium tetrahymenae]